MPYHKDAMIKSKEFRRSVEEPETGNVVVMLDARKRERIKHNRGILGHIVRTVIWLGKQGVAFRGHREQAAATNKSNRGNFLELISFLSQYDAELARHLEVNKKTTYVSPNIQNQVINIIGSEYIRPRLIEEVRNAKHFSVICDEATSARTEYMSIVLRFVDGHYDIREEFMGFVQVIRTSGRFLAEKIISVIENDYGLDMANCRGQGYDGAASMSSDRCGVQALIKERVPQAHYFHCASHCLNLVITHSCSDIHIKTTISKISEVCTFFGYPKRQELLVGIIKRCHPQQTRTAPLVSICQTRWSQRHIAYSHFYNSYEYVLKALESICYDLHRDKVPPELVDSWPNPVKVDALSLLSKITEFQFISSFAAVYSLISPLEGITTKLQGRAIDICKAYNLVKKEKEYYRNLRTAEEYDYSWWTMALDMAEKADVEPVRPRAAGRMTHRPNTPASTPREYYLRNLYLPLLDHIIAELDSQFSDMIASAIQAILLVPAEVVTHEVSDYIEVVKIMEEDLSSPQVFPIEFQRWKSVCAALPVPDRATSLAEAIKYCDKDIYPNIYTILAICCTWPVTTCECERSFSGLRRLNTYLRSSQTAERLDSLAMINIHRSMDINVESIINTFARLQPRRMELSDILNC